MQNKCTINNVKYLHTNYKPFSKYLPPRGTAGTGSCSAVEMSWKSNRILRVFLKLTRVIEHLHKYVSLEIWSICTNMLKQRICSPFFYGKSNNTYHVLMDSTKYSTNVAFEEKFCGLGENLLCCVITREYINPAPTYGIYICVFVLLTTYKAP